MKLIKINGRIWELTILQSEEYVDSEKDDTELNVKNSCAIQGLGWFRGIVRVLSGNKVKSKATAVIETTVSGLPHQMTYEVYHNSKGFYCIVQRERIFLKDLIEE
jgi:hypothetical protein